MRTRLEFNPEWIIAESDGLLIVHKLAGLLTHATADRSRENLVDLLRRARPDLTELTLQHRLDRETSGVILFTTSVEMRAPVAQLFENRRVEKEYLCWVQGKRLESSWSVEATLQQRSGRVRVGPGQAARTDFRLLKREGSYCLLQACPLTGRKHQIRAHLAHRGLPIVGDELFGGPPSHRLLLHAHRLSLVHPRTEKIVTFEDQPDEDFQPRASGCGAHSNFKVSRSLARRSRPTGRTRA